MRAFKKEFHPEAQVSEVTQSRGFLEGDITEVVTGGCNRRLAEVGGGGGLPFRWLYMELLSTKAFLNCS